MRSRIERHYLLVMHPLCISDEFIEGHNGKSVRVVDKVSYSKTQIRKSLWNNYITIAEYDFSNMDSIDSVDKFIIDNADLCVMPNIYASKALLDSPIFNNVYFHFTDIKNKFDVDTFNLLKDSIGGNQ